MHLSVPPDSDTFRFFQRLWNAVTGETLDYDQATRLGEHYLMAFALSAACKLEMMPRVDSPLPPVEGQG